MRQEEVDDWGFEGEERLVRRDGVIAHVDRAQQAAEQMPVLLLPQPPESRRHRGVASAPAGEAAVPVEALGTAPVVTVGGRLIDGVLAPASLVAWAEPAA